MTFKRRRQTNKAYRLPKITTKFKMPTGFNFDFPGVLAAPQYPASSFLTPLGTDTISYVVPATEGSGNYTYTLHPSDTLPAGYSVNPSTGDIEGTAGASAEFLYVRIRVTDSLGAVADSAAFRISVGAELPAPVFYDSMDDINTMTSGMRLATGSGGVFNQTVVGSPTSLPGNIGEARDFTTSSYYHEISPTPASLRIQGDLTATWCQFISTLPHDQMMFGDGESTDSSLDNFSYYIATNSSGRPYLFHEFGSGTDQSVTASSAITQNVWQQIGVRRDTNTKEVSFYYDGVHISTGGYTTNPDNGSGTKFRVGISPSGSSTTAMEGDADEAALWNSKLSDNQMAALGALKTAGISLADWIKGDAPTAPVYASQRVMTVGVSQTTYLTTEATSPEGHTLNYFAYDTMPAGITVNSANGRLEGTPTTVAYGTYRVAVSDGMHIVISNPIEIGVVADYSVYPSPLAYWNADNDDFVDASGNGHDATANLMSFEDGYVGRSFSFDGVTSYMEVAHDAAYSLQQAVWCCHFKATGSASYLSTLMTKANNSSGAPNSNLLFVDNSIIDSIGKVIFITKNNNSTNITVASSNTYGDGNWHDVVVDYNRVGAAASLTVDGTDSASGSCATTTLSSAVLRMGDPLYPSANDWRAPTSMDEVAIFSALTTDEKATYHVLRMLEVSIAGYLAGNINDLGAGSP